MDVITIEEGAFYELLKQVIGYVKKNMIEHQKWISPEEAMQLLNITSKTTLQKMRNEGKISYSQPAPNILLYDRESIDRFLEKNVPETF
jgi:hypothetical protein